MTSPITRRTALGAAGMTLTASCVGNIAPVSATTLRASPELLGLIDVAIRAGAERDAHYRHVYEPAKTRYDAAVDALEASTPHTTVDAGIGHQGQRIIWSTDRSTSVSVARSMVEMAKDGRDLDPDNVAAARRLCAASLRRQRSISHGLRQHDLGSILDEDERLIELSIAADVAVVMFPAATAADLHAKLAFMVDQGMGEHMNWLPEMLADAHRLANVEG